MGEVLDQHRPAALKDLVMRADADARKVLLLVAEPSLRHRQVEEHLLVVAVRRREGGVIALAG